MSISLRNPGSYTFWVVEIFVNGNWHTITTSNLAVIPGHVRYDTASKLMEPFRSFGASGEVWQKTGTHGVTNALAAVRIAMLLNKYDPNYEYRSAKIEASWRRASTIREKRR